MSTHCPISLSVALSSSLCTGSLLWIVGHTGVLQSPRSDASQLTSLWKANVSMRNRLNLATAIMGVVTDVIVCGLADPTLKPLRKRKPL